MLNNESAFSPFDNFIRKIASKANTGIVVFFSRNFFILLGFFSVLPFIINSFFTNPAADDFLYVNTAKINGLWASIAAWYNHITGRYFSNFILMNNPLSINWMFGYKLVPIVYLILLFLALYFLFSAIGKKYFRPKSILAFTFIILTIYLHRFPSTIWGLYFMTGATTYQLANILTLFLLTALIKLKESRNNRQKTTYFILSALLLFMAIGCNEIMLLMVDLMLLTIISIDYFKTRKANYTLLALLVIAFGFSIIVFLAPGNNVRVTHNDDSHLLIPAILATLKRTISQIIFRLIWSPLLIFSIVFIPLFNRIARLMIRDNNPIFKVHPLIALGWMILLPMFLFVLHYNLSPHEPHCERIVTMLFLFFILALFYFEILLLVHIKRKQLFNTGFIKIHSAVWFILLLFYVLVPFREHNQIRVAYTDLISGKSYKNNKQMTERFEYLKNSDCTHCTVPEITVRPETIYYIWFSLSENKKFWMNREQAIYFKKSSVAVGVEETKATGQ